MTRKTLVLLIVGLMAMTIGESLAFASWEAYIIRKGGGDNINGDAPAINDVWVGVDPAKEFVISQGGMKAAYGTNALNGLTIGDITQLRIDRHDDRSNFVSGSGPHVAPYFNIWVTDGAGNYAVIANEPSNPAFQPLFSNGYDLGWSDIADKVAKVFENTNTSWITSLDVGNDGLTFSDVASLAIGAPADPNASWAGLGTGAPRKLNPAYNGVNDQYLDVFGFNWIFGDTLSNYVSGNDGYIVNNPAAAPEPSAMMLLGVGALTLLRRRKKT